MQNSSESLIGQAKSMAQMGESRMNAAFQAVPNDKLDWSPAPTSRSALQIIGHLCAVNESLAGGLRGEPLPPQTTPADLVRNTEPLTDRAHAERRLAASTEAVLAALDQLTPERIAADISTPFGMMPMTYFMMIPGLHMLNHAGQIDYLQTMWGDMEMHR